MHTPHPRWVTTWAVRATQRLATAMPRNLTHFGSARQRGVCANRRHMHCSKLHSIRISSSVRAGTVGGPSMPSVLAVLRLMTSSNLVGSCTLHRKVRWLLGLEGAIGVASRAPIGITKGDRGPPAGEEQASRYSVPMRAGSTSRTNSLEAAGAAVPAGRRMVNTDPLPTSLVTVTSPPIMRQSLRVMARPNPVPPY
jgi:hypothetical protein